MVVMLSASDGVDGYGAVGNGVDGDAVVPEEIHAHKGFGVELKDLGLAPDSLPNNYGFCVGYFHEFSGRRASIDPILDRQAKSCNVSVGQEQLAVES